MTIGESIEQLKDIEKQYGKEVEVYFDCPDCKKSFTPDYLALVAVVKAKVESK